MVRASSQIPRASLGVVGSGSFFLLFSHYEHDIDGFLILILSSASGCFNGFF